MGWKLPGILRALGFSLWLIVTTVAASTLTSWHAVGLPTPLPAAQFATPRASWRVEHFLSADCACSRDLARYLTARGPIAAGVEEVTLLRSVDRSRGKILLGDLHRAGFSVTEMDAEAASLGGVGGVPMLQIQAPDGRVRFRGGYRDRNTPPGKYLDLNILSSLMASKPVPAPRVLGCATSRRLKEMLDPFSLKTLLQLP